jgi:hypothetical protein
MAEEKEKAAPAVPKYGIDDLAKALGINPASARVRLRNEGIEKTGRSYGWNSKADLDALVKKLKGDAKAGAPAKDAKTKKAA